MTRNNLKLTFNIIFLILALLINDGHSYIIQKEMVYVKQVSVSDNDHYPQKIVLSLHRDENSDPIFDVILEKYIHTLQELVSERTNSVESRKYQPQVYQDINKQSVVEMQRVSDNQFHVQGKLCLDGNVIEIEPIEESSERSGHYFSIKRNDISDCLNTDNDKNEIESIEKDPLIFKLTNAFDRLSDEKLSKGRVKREIDHLTIDLLMVIDFSAYSWWKDMVGKPDSPESEIMATIKQYYAYIFKGIDERFRGIQSQAFVIDLAFSGLFVAKTEIESYWTTTSVIDGDGESMRVMVNSSEALDKFQKWLDESDSLPNYDHAILFTGTNLTYAGSPGNTGLAFASSMCRNISNSSIVEDIFDFRTVTYATQQVARALGTRDDMDNNDCLEFFNYMMVPKFKLPIKAFGSNKWKFSQCSEQYISDYIIELNDDGLMCLKETTLEDRYPPDLAELITDLQGVTYNGRRQCENAFGLGSDVCRKEIKTEYSNICGGLPCTILGSEYCRLILPADGTPCGNKKYCLEGSCIEHSDAPESSDNCAFGNEQSMGCYNLVVSEPSQCYITDIKYRCCQTCALFYTGIEGCEYGDRSDDCMPAECANGDQDYASKTCCFTCFDGPTPFARPQLSTITELSMFSSKISEVVSTTSASTTTPISHISSQSMSSILSSTYHDQASSILSSVLPTLSAKSSTSGISSPSSSILPPSSETTPISVQTTDKFKVKTDVRATEKNDGGHLIDKTIISSTLPPQTTYQEHQNISTESYTLFTESVFDNRSIPQVSDLRGDLEIINQSSSEATIHVEGVTASKLFKYLSPSKTTSETTKSYVPAETIETMVNTSDTPTKSVTTISTAETTKSYISSAETNKTEINISETPIKSAVHTEKCSITPICNCIVKVTPVSSAHSIYNISSSKQASLDSSNRTTCIFTVSKDTNRTVIDRNFFKGLARSMKNSQRRISNGLYRNMKTLYTTVSGHLKGFHREYENENESGREGSEILSNDDDDMNRKLMPVWNKHFSDMISNLERDIRDMRYRVLASINRHIKDGIK